MNTITKTAVCFAAMIIFTQFQLNAQTEWIKHYDNPILSPGEGGSSSEEGFPFIYLMKVDNVYHAWVTESDGMHDQIVFATSIDGIDFNLSADPALTPTNGSSYFDSEGVFGACVLEVGDTYYMWYNGYNTQPYFLGPLRTGLATSTDGINWTRYSDNPVLELGAPGSWDSYWAYVNSVLYENGLFKMWYTGANNSGLCRVGYATSTDGIIWEKYAGNPVLQGAPGNWDQANNQNGRVIHTGNLYEMWYNGNAGGANNFQIGYATSLDGINWEKFENKPVMYNGPSGSFDSDWCWAPSVLYDEGNYHMWYTGYSNNLYYIGYAADSLNTGIHPAKYTGVDSELIKVYPNPASDETVVSFQVVSPGHVRISLYDAKGQEIIILVDEFRQTGSYSHRINTRDFRPVLISAF
jgi:predicted GH43/DUF377 family glycosyl hydrolase